LSYFDKGLAYFINLQICIRQFLVKLSAFYLSYNPVILASQILKKYPPTLIKNDVLSGLTVALALVPEAVAFALLAGVHPLVGLYAAFTMGLIAGIFGGRPGMITGATGAIAVVVAPLIASHGVEFLFLAVVLAGILQMLFGVFKLGKFIRLVPHPVFLGFVNGLALVIGIAQIKQFQVDGQWITGTPLLIMGIIIIATMAIMHYLPKITKAFPATLFAIIVLSLVVIGFDIDTRTVGDVASIKGGLPQFHLPDVVFSVDTLLIVLPYAFMIAMVGLIESLLTLNLLDEMTETTGKPNKESIAQGLANTTTGLFGGMGGCAMVGQSMINVKSGGTTKISAIVASIFLLLFIISLSEYIEMIPIAVLIGVMFMVVIGTFEWGSLRLFGKVPVADIVVGISVAVITVLTDNLAIAVITGIILSALSFAWQHAKSIAVTTSTRDNEKIYKVNGVVFFANITNFHTLFTPKEDPSIVYVDFAHSRITDHSAIEAIDKLAERYQKLGKELHLQHLSPECREVLRTAKDLVDVNINEDPRYHIADDKLS
jgi:SulP family sulfate permease